MRRRWPYIRRCGGHAGVRVDCPFGDHLACAVADVPVGIDIEPLQPRKHLDTLIEATTTEAERAALPGPDGRERCRGALVAFFELWTLKEAWIKCHGGNLFQTMMGHVVEALPAPLDTANGDMAPQGRRAGAGGVRAGRRTGLAGSQGVAPACARGGRLSVPPARAVDSSQVFSSDAQAARSIAA
jgi:hypothetical protein